MPWVINIICFNILSYNVMFITNQIKILFSSCNTSIHCRGSVSTSTHCGPTFLGSRYIFVGFQKLTPLDSVLVISSCNVRVFFSRMLHLKMKGCKLANSIHANNTSLFLKSSIGLNHDSLYNILREQHLSF